MLTLLLRPKIHLNKSLIRLKNNLFETLFSEFYKAKFDNISTAFFGGQLGLKFVPFQLYFDAETPP